MMAIRNTGDSAGDRSPQLAGVRHPALLLGLFVAAFLILVVIALQGYRYIALTSEYASRSLVHMDAVTDAELTLQGAQRAYIIPSDRLRTLVQTGRDQAVWCLEALGLVERQLLAVLGEDTAITICKTDIQNADEALALLAYANISSLSPQETLAVSNELMQILDRMLADSRKFAPYVVRLREKITQLVRIGTFSAGLAMLALLLALSRTFVANWRAVSVQAREIARQSKRFKLAMQSNTDGLALFGGDHRLMECNGRFADLLGLKDVPAHGVTLMAVLSDLVDKGDLESFEGNADDLLSEIDATMAGGDEAGLEVSFLGDRHVAISRADTDLGDCLLLVKDITQRVRSDRLKEERARQMQKKTERFAADAKMDPLTGLANRRGLDEEIAERVADGPMTLIRIDLDRFKEVNDTFGHDAGDHVLKHVAALMRAFGRDKDLPVRVGGDEFLILCEPGTTSDRAVAFANRLLDRLREPLKYQDKKLTFGASFGVATSDDGSDDLETLLRSADAALYLAKESGRGTVKLFTPDLKKTLSRDRHLAETLRPALLGGAFRAFGQSIHHVRDGSFAGVEVLARWDHPSYGLLAPADFLHVVRDLGLEAELDATILTTALAELEQLEMDAFRFPRVSFNVSSARLLDPSLRDTLNTEQAYWDGRIALEIEERIGRADGRSATAQLAALKGLGIQIDLDNFGSGRTSINSLIDIGPSRLKLDRRFMVQVDKDSSADPAIKAIVEMAKALNIQIVVEGVETEAQARIVAGLGVDQMQGFLFSRPCPLPDLVDQLKVQEVRPTWLQSGQTEDAA